MLFPYDRAGLTDLSQQDEPRAYERELYESLMNEAFEVYGTRVKYMPVELRNTDALWGDDVDAAFTSAYEMIMFSTSLDGWDGGAGAMFNKFGITDVDEANFYVVIRKFAEKTGGLEPKVGDLILHEVSGNIFEVTWVEDEDPFNAFGAQIAWKLVCRRWTYSGEELSSGVDEIDSVDGVTSVDDGLDDADVVESEAPEVVDFSEDDPFRSLT